MSLFPWVFAGGKLIYYAGKGVKDALESAFAPRPQVPSTAEQLAMEGAKYLQEKQYGKSLEYFERAIAADPKLEDAWLCKGAALSKLGRVEESAASYRECARLDPRRDDAWHNLAGSLIKLKRFDQALEASYKAVNLAPTDMKRLLLLGGIELECGRENDALLTFDRVLETNPYEKSALLGKASALGMDGHEQEALEYIKKAMTIRNPLPSKYGAHRSKYTTYSAPKSRFPIDPSYPLTVKGWVLCQMGRFEEGLQLLQEAKALIETHPDDHLTSLEHEEIVNLESLCRDLPSIFSLNGVKYVRIRPRSLRIALADAGCATKGEIAALIAKHPAFSVELIS